MESINKIHVVINPASGQPDNILNKLNSVFHSANVEWNISITQESGDATDQARKAINSGFDAIAAYGGDGTVMEVAHAVKGCETPMAILPGGTANLMAVELGIPKELSKAAEIAVNPESVVRKIDMGEVGERTFMLRLGMGVAGEKIRLADRELKDRWGIMAYSIAGLKALKDVKTAHYKIKVDGEAYETDGKSCLIDNAGNLGMAQFTASKKISVSDGLLDVLIVRDASVSSLIAAGRSITGREPQSDSVMHWQGCEIMVEADPPSVVQADGEILSDTPITARILPGVLPVLVPGV